MESHLVVKLHVHIIRGLMTQIMTPSVIVDIKGNTRN